MKMIIGGKKVDSSAGNVINLINPADQKHIDTVPKATREDVEQTICNAQKGYNEWAQYSLDQRITILKNFMELYLDNADKLARYITEDMGKLITEARGCIADTKVLMETFLAHAACLGTEVLPVGNHGKNPNDLVFTVREPLGIVVAIIPWNWPIDLLAHKSIPALVMGNALIVKPSSNAPRACIRFVELLLEAGVPANAVQVITGSGESLGDWLCDDPRISCVTLTGSTEVGIKIAQTAGKHLHRTCLELGGNDAFVILADADIDMAIQESVDARLSNSGQTCCASKRFLVHNSIKEQYISGLVNALKNVKLGNPMDESTQCAPLVSKSAAIEVENQIRLSVEQGGKVHCGGKRVNESFLEPTVLEATRDMDVAKDMEVFAPVFTVIGYDTTDEAIEIANNSQYGLSSGVLGNNLFELMKVAKGMQAGACVVNGASLYRCKDEPFGGYKKSGLGKEGGKYTLEEMSQIKTIVLKKSF